MKDFKCLPKMKTGGSVQKYSEGNIVQEYKSAVKGNKNLDPGIYNKAGSSKGFVVDGKEYKTKGVDMPSYESKGKTFPGIDGTLTPKPPKTRGDAMLLKNGGKAKRGNKK